MTYSQTTTKTATFTLTHARELASRVVADMKLCSRHYGKPIATDIDEYRDELIELLRYGYLETYEFGFKKNDERVVSWFYRVSVSGDLEGGVPGGIFARADITGAIPFNFATYSTKWSALTAQEKADFKTILPIQRKSGQGPTDGDGYWVSDDRGYAAGGTLMTRNTYRPR